MGSSQTLNIGLTNLDKSRGSPPSPPLQHPAAGRTHYRSSCAQAAEAAVAVFGDRDNLFRVSKGVHDYLTEKGVPHIWRVDTNGHDTGEMSNSLYLFAQRLFKE